MTYYPERASDQMAYLTLFPIGASMRANLMVYRTMDDPWLRDMRRDPEHSLFQLMPKLHRLTGDIEVVGPIKIRPADLYVTEGYRQAGIVLAGDAFSTSCPAVGAGTGKVFTDVERLCNVHIPNWLASPGMAADKIAQFYDDPVKRACDQASATKAYRLRSMSIDESLAWQAQRWMRFTVRAAIGVARRFGAIAAARPLHSAGSGPRADLRPPARAAHAANPPKNILVSKSLTSCRSDIGSQYYSTARHRARVVVSRGRAGKRGATHHLAVHTPHPVGKIDHDPPQRHVLEPPFLQAIHMRDMAGQTRNNVGDGSSAAALDPPKPARPRPSQGTRRRRRRT